MHLKILLGSLSVALLLTSQIAKAQNSRIDYKLVDTGILSHNVHGKGIEMRIKPSSLPDGGLRGDIVKQAMVRICKFYAPKVIPFVKNKTGFAEPKFVAVRIVSGNSVFGKYVLQAFAINDGTCGKELN